MGQTEIKRMLSKVSTFLEKDERINSIFVAGSLKTEAVTDFSDIDLWLIFSEESGINSFKEEVTKVFSKFGILMGVYDCTAHHFFVVYKSGVQVDLNLITAAQYFSIRNDSGENQVLYDRQLYVLERGQLAARKKEEYIKRLLLVGYSTLERSVSKFLKENYFVVVRFLDAVRHNSILPLLSFAAGQKKPTAVSLKMDSLDPRLKALFIKSYTKPTRESGLEGLEASLELLGTLAVKYRIKDFDARYKKIKKTLINL